MVEGRVKSEVARDYGVSRRWVITLVQRYLAEGEAGLEPRSRRPVRSPRRTPVEVEDEIVAIRKELDRSGHEAGAATIAFHLERRHGAAPAVSTIWRILTARGFVTPQPHKRPKSTYIRFAAEQPNERWQADITHWTLADGTDVEILNILDDHSRLCLASHARRVFKAADVDGLLPQRRRRYGDPASVLADNGAVFTGRYRGQGRVALEVTLHRRGIGFRHSRPYHPQTCGKVERFHQTLKLAGSPPGPSPDPAQLQAQLDTFGGYYNTKRPHRALGRRTPTRPTRPGPRPSRPALPLDDAHYRIRHDNIDTSGKFTLRHNSRLHHIGIGRRHAGTDILVLVHDLHVRIPTPDGELLREPHSTRPGTTNHSAKRERCPETPVHGVPRHHMVGLRGLEPAASSL